MKKSPLYPLYLFLLLLLFSCQPIESVPSNFNAQKIVTLQVKNDLLTLTEEQTIDVAVYKNKEPKEWGENVTGVKTNIATDQKVMALTFDACGGAFGNGYDEDLISFLIKEEIPATLFVNERWLLDNQALFMELVAQPFFQIENHGTDHAPLSVNGKEAWGIQGTNSPQEVMNEIMQNHQTVKELTGEEMTLFRSGTAFYDEVAVQIAQELGYDIVNFDILGDAGATYSSTQVKNALMNAKNGSIALLHMNQPNSGTAAGVKQAIPLLREAGFSFVTLENENLQ